MKQIWIMDTNTRTDTSRDTLIVRHTNGDVKLKYNSMDWKTEFKCEWMYTAGLLQICNGIFPIC